MPWENKIMRTVRVRNVQVKGTLARLLATIAEAGGSVGEIRLLRESLDAVVRDITLYADDEEQMARILEAMQHNPGTTVLQVRDEVLEVHQQGKIAVRSRYQVDSLAMLRRVYTPGVAEVCKRIQQNPDLAWDYTAKSHLVAVVTDGSAILGLGNIGPLAGMPVMEGKAMLMEQMVGLSGIPILVNTQDVDAFVNTVAYIAPTFAAIQLEDIAAPRCFAIEERLQALLDIPVMHDDQHGTAVVVTAALQTACRRVGLRLQTARVGCVGLGAAGMAIARMLMRLTGNPVWGADLRLDALQHLEQLGGQPSTLNEIMAICDIVIATTGAPNLIRPEQIRRGQIIFALSNPVPEIDPNLAEEAGAAFACDGKVVNNLLGFPGILRGAVDARARRMTSNMYMAAVRTLVELTPETGEELLPNPLDREVHRAVAHAVARQAYADGIARQEPL